MKQQWITVKNSALSLASFWLAMSAAQADIKYTQVMRSVDAAKDAAPLNSTTKYVRQGAERTETTMQMGQVKIQNISIRLCEKKQTVKLEPSAKIYTIVEDGASSAPATPGARPVAAQADGGKATTGKMIMTSNVQDLGEEEVAGFKTRHVMMTTKMQMSGCAGDGEHNSKMEIWTSDIRDAIPCQETSGPDYGNMAGTASSACKIEFEQKGNTDAVNKAYRGLVMRMKIYNDDKVSMIQEVTMLSQAKLGDEPFTIPADYKQVTEQEFQQAQSRAMMQAMMEQAQAGSKNDEPNAGTAQDDANDAPKEADAPDEEPKEEPKEKPKEKRRKLPKFKLPF